jgi:hypothetical protein
MADIIKMAKSVGLCCMVYVVLPQFKAPGASLVVLTVVLLLPVFDFENSEHRYVRIMAASGGILMQAFGIAMVCYYIFNSDLIGYDGSLLAIFIISAILISLKYWETFVVGKKKSRWLPQTTVNTTSDAPGALNCGSTTYTIQHSPILWRVSNTII